MIGYDDFNKMFSDLEKRGKLFTLEFNGVRYWKYVRYYVWQMLTHKLFENNPHMDFENTHKIAKYQFKFQKFTDKILHNVNLGLQKDILLFTFPRRILYHNKLVSTVTDEIALHLKRSACIVETPYFGGYLRPAPIRGIKYFDVWDGVGDEKKVYVPINRGQLFKQLLSVFEDEFNVKFLREEKTVLLRDVNYFIMYRDELKVHYNKVISKINPKLVLYTMAHFGEWVVLTETLKEMGIPGIEIMHGYTSSTDPAYNLEIGLNDSLPDYLFVYSQIQKDSISCWGIPQDHVKVVGNPWLEKKKQEFMVGKKEGKEGKKKIIFISSTQMSIEKYIVYLADKIDQNKYEIIFKLHPIECSEPWEERYPGLPDNVTVIDNNNNDIHYYLANADFVIGIRSTSLFEASFYQTQIIILKEEMYQIMDLLLKTGRAFLVSSTEELYSCIMNSFVDVSQCMPFYAENAIENINREIENIIKERE